MERSFLRNGGDGIVHDEREYGVAVQGGFVERREGLDVEKVAVTVLDEVGGERMLRSQSCGGGK